MKRFQRAKHVSAYSKGTFAPWTLEIGTDRQAGTVGFVVKIDFNHFDPIMVPALFEHVQHALNEFLRKPVEYPITDEE